MASSGDSVLVQHEMDSGLMRIGHYASLTLGLKRPAHRAAALIGGVQLRKVCFGCMSGELSGISLSGDRRRSASRRNGCKRQRPGMRESVRFCLILSYFVLFCPLFGLNNEVKVKREAERGCHLCAHTRSRGNFVESSPEPGSKPVESRDGNPAPACLCTISVPDALSPTPT